MSVVGIEVGHLEREVILNSTNIHSFKVILTLLGFKNATKCVLGYMGKEDEIVELNGVVFFLLGNYRAGRGLGYLEFNSCS